MPKGRMNFDMLSWLMWLGLCARFVVGQSNYTFTKGQKFQILLLGAPDTSKMPLPPTDAPVWDVDLFDSDAATIQTLKSAGKIVICYFSAGTRENWRDDARDFPAADVGKVLPEWPDENWVRTGSAKIREIMAQRIRLAGEKGCHAIDPDNTDGYQNDNGLNLRNTDAVDYMQWMQKEALKYNMKIGLKNSLDIVNTVAPIMDFAVNEQCAQLNECNAYDQFLASGKPVFHIEYPNPLNTGQRNSVYCNGPGTNGMSTVLKELNLNGRTIYCDGSEVNTPTKGGSSPPRPSFPPRPSTTRPPVPSTSRPPPPTTIRTTTSPPRPTSTPRPSTTRRPSSTQRISSSPRPTTTSPGGGGCRSKHWDQCGGQDWKGCTVCESPYRCQGVSPPWYYQCL